ncbi:MAG: galactose mutarotase [Lachnospiraceae bacterium]|nr:galactose mutarotase [Lachnospiraceae bacterium]
MSMTLFGQVPEGDVYQVCLRNRRGFEAKIISLGASLRSLKVPDAKGRLRDVVLGYDEAAAYEKNPYYFGATIGRYAGRIAGAAFEWEGRQYRLEANEGKNQLHGGPYGFSSRLWMPIVISEQEVLFRLVSPAGEMGFPGRVDVELRYRLAGNALHMEYQAFCDETTPLSLTHHSYFNLGGHDSPSVGQHRLQIFADRYTPTGADMIPTGEIRPVEGSCLDLRQPVKLQELLEAEELSKTRGLDHNFVLNPSSGPKAILFAPEDELSMEVYTDRPGLQVYTAGFLGEEYGKEGAFYRPGQGICLETQGFPDAMHHENFPSCLLRPGELWHSETIYRFEGSGISDSRKAQMIYL